MVVAVASANGAGETGPSARVVLSLVIAAESPGSKASSSVIGVAALNLNALHQVIIGEYASESCWMLLEHVMSMFEEGTASAGVVEVAAVLIPVGRQHQDQRLQRDIVAFFGMEEEDDGGEIAATSRPPIPELYALGKSMFNQAAGRDFLRRAGTSVEVDAQGSVKFGALQAIRVFMEEKMGGWHEESSLAVRDVFSLTMTAMDVIPDETLQALDVFRYGICRHSRGQMRSGEEFLSLFEFLSPHVITRPGKQVLRQNLKQPLRDVDMIHRRQDAIEELMHDQNQLVEVQAALREVSRTMGGVDVLCRAVHLRGPAEGFGDLGGTGRIPALTSSLIQLHEFCEGARLLQVAISPFRSARLVAIQAMFEKSKQSRAAVSEALLGLFERHVVESFSRDNAKKSPFMSKSQQIFALKTSPSTRLLDIHRARFSAGTEKVKEVAARLRASYPAECGTLSVKYAAGRGFFFCVSTGGAELPAESGLKCLSGRGGQGRRGRASSLQVTCEELNALNARIEAASNDCLEMTRDVLLHHLSELLHHHLSPLVSMQDAIAELDMLSGLSSFAMVQESELRPYVRPLVTRHGPALVIQEGRHPTLERQLQERGSTFVPNDTMLAEDCSACILTGANALGKSIYLKQSALCVVLAQIGALVPAAFMSITPFQGICIIKETNSNRQMRQMREVVRTINRPRASSASGTPRGHLVLVDEVCDVASPVSRLALSWALVEEFLVTNTMALVATHVNFLSKLADLYPNVIALMIDPDRKIRNGTVSEGGYGIALASRMGFPRETVETATRISASILERVSHNVRVQEYPSLQRERSVLKAYSRIQCLEELKRRGIGGDLASSLAMIRAELREGKAAGRA